MTPLDRDWLRAHPLPAVEGREDKDDRGRVLAIGGGRFVPGALRLTGEAALRAGAGKLQMATVADAAMHLGTLVPEAAVISLPADDDGEIASAAPAGLLDRIDGCDCAIIGPGMSRADTCGPLIEQLLGAPRSGLSIVLDAAAIGASADHRAAVRAHAGRVVLTPHFGEMASLTGFDARRIGAEAAEIAPRTAADFGSIVVLKGSETLIAGPDGECLRYPGGGVGLATGGSGDVLAGILGGLLARGAEPVVAAAWAVWVHGEAGRMLAREVGPIGFLAREIVEKIPAILDNATRGQD